MNAKRGLATLCSRDSNVERGAFRGRKCDWQSIRSQDFVVDVLYGIEVAHDRDAAAARRRCGAQIAGLRGDATSSPAKAFAAIFGQRATLPEMQPAAP